VEFGISFSPNDASSLTICLIARILADSSVSLTFCVMHKLLVFSLKEQTVKLFLIFYKSTVPSIQFMSLLNSLRRDCVPCRILKQVGPVKIMEKLRIWIILRPFPN
jgi:hypothetical protein